MLRHFLMIWTLCFCFMSFVAYAEETEQERVEQEAAEKHITHIKDEFESMDVDIHFYGKVIDQNSNPVESADVSFHIKQYSPVLEKLFGERKNIQAKTDAQGCFSVVGEKGRSIYIDKIKKDGYEFSLSQNPGRGYKYSGVKNPFIPDQSNPIIFNLRKKGESIFLITESDLKLSLFVNESGKSVGADLVRRIRIDDISKPIFNGEKLTCDLKMTATFNATGKSWSVLLMPGDSNGGIIAMDQLIYEAPSEGYQPEYAFNAEGHNLPANKYFYLRSRDPSIYSRFEIQFVTVGDDIVQIKGNSVTNPYGDRNLEQATDLPYAVIKKLTDEIRSAYKQNKRPVKPDLQKLINEAKGNTLQ